MTEQREKEINAELVKIDAKIDSLRERAEPLQRELWAARITPLIGKCFKSPLATPERRVEYVVVLGPDLRFVDSVIVTYFVPYSFGGYWGQTWRPVDDLKFENEIPRAEFDAVFSKFQSDLSLAPTKAAE